MSLPLVTIYEAMSYKTFEMNTGVMVEEMPQKQHQFVHFFTFPMLSSRMLIICSTNLGPKAVLSLGIALLTSTVLPSIVCDSSKTRSSTITYVQSLIRFALL